MEYPGGAPRYDSFHLVAAATHAIPISVMVLLIGAETSVVIAGAPSALVMGLCLGLTRDEAARRQ